MFTLRTATPVITEPLPAPPLCLTGKAPPRGTTVDLNHIDTPANMTLWPLFHNGVANGLRITPDAHNIDNTWIIFNKSKGGVDPQMEHAGFLLALGLNGHLKNLALNSTFNYLEKLHEMTSVGILLGKYLVTMIIPAYLVFSKDCPRRFVEHAIQISQKLWQFTSRLCYRLPPWN